MTKVEVKVKSARSLSFRRERETSPLSRVTVRLSAAHHRLR